MTSVGRMPQQGRAARRRVSILDAAAELIAEVGFEATTMTGIAERAGASVGALYDYFPDKTSIAFALLNQYAQEIEAYWKPLIARAESLTSDDFADLFVESMLAFMKERPAHLQLMSARIQFSRDPAARRAIRVELANAFRAKNPALPEDHAFLAANIALQMVRSMKVLLTEAGPGERDPITVEFKKLLRFYLADVLSENRSPT